MRRTDIVVTPTHVRAFGRKLPCTVGRGGITKRKKEGDGATPRGTHRLVGMLYRPDRLSRPADWALPIRPGDLWSDDPAHEDYNLMVRAPYPHSHEALRRADPLYDVVLLTDWNWPYAVKGRGSAIFLHQWRKPGYPTEGCVAFRRDHLYWLLPRIRYDTRVIVL
ncbi:L,D-transpeptidase family protein [Shimia ponticola]|uniref:L,D-transpeptidase family protein n=1 Tax=Shimia ponticola TaxID=2582893 RepID=UPI0011BE9ACC|nr:L,D-transpeptidase family protein [Shimia ponticola]